MYKAKYFRKSEFACQCGCGFDDIDQELLYKLDRARSMAKVPFRITSGCRCKAHNKTVGGGSHSQHLLGKAADIAVNKETRGRILIALVMAGFERFGIGKDFIHVDIKPGVRAWLYNK